MAASNERASCQFWLHGFPEPGATEELAMWAETSGFDGLVLADSQNLVADPFVELGALAQATTHLGLGTGIINPLTRHPAVVASAIATVQRLTDAPVVLGVGRGDSSLRGIGLAPPTTVYLAAFLAAIRGYLRGEQTSFGGTTSRLSWIDSGQVPVPSVELAATGPRTIALAATASDRVMLTLGASRTRIAQAIDHARNARADAGLDPANLQVGAYLNIGCNDDPAVARGLVRGSTAIFAHFSSMSAAAAADLTGNASNVVTELGRGYDAARHGLSSASHVGALDDEFVDEFAVVGSAARCRERLAELIALGLDRIILVPGSRDSDPELLQESNTRLADEVLPTLRQ